MKNLFRRYLPAVLAVVLVTLPLARARAQESAEEIKPVAVFSIAGSDELLGDIGYITEAAGAGGRVLPRSGTGGRVRSGEPLDPLRKRRHSVFIPTSRVAATGAIPCPRSALLRPPSSC